MNKFANMTRRSTRTSERTTTISETRDDVLTSAVFLAMKKKYGTVKSTSKSSVIQTEPSSHSMSVTPTAMIPKGPKHSQGHSRYSSGPVVSKSLGSSPTKDR